MTILCKSLQKPFLEDFEINMQILLIKDSEVCMIWQSDVHRNISVMHIFHRVKRYFYSLDGNKPIRDNTDPTLGPFILSHDKRMSRFSDAIENSNSNILFSHAALYGSSLVLHSMRAREDVCARTEMLRCARTLVGICKDVHNHQSAHIILSSLVPMVHMINAIRIFAHELRRPEAQENPKLSTEYCQSIEILLDFLDEMTALYPAWAGSTQVLKQPLTVAMNSLAT
ncbi:hypothetical protein DL93DRAFT_97492 [Clavulina sp. PMI_390]|nr:hypothetical protein DL93DRAFT_97492 [Clavulina sp. PMI_390]